MLRVSRGVKAAGGELIARGGDGQVLRIVPLGETCTVDEVFGAIESTPVYFEDIDTPTTDEWVSLTCQSSHSRPCDHLD